MRADGLGEQREAGEAEAVVLDPDGVPPELVEDGVEGRRFLALEERARERQRRVPVERLARDRAQLAVVFGQLEVHAALRGRPSIRSEMMFFWICSLPP